jgi:phosphotransferase system HPr (HPr) family protein
MNAEVELENKPQPMCRTRIRLPGCHGLHGREAAMLVKLERSFNADLLLECCGQQANAKSIMGLLSLEGDACSEMTATTTGPEAEAMMQAVEQLFSSGFRATREIPAASLFHHKFAFHFNLSQ